MDLTESGGEQMRYVEKVPMTLLDILKEQKTGFRYNLTWNFCRCMVYYVIVTLFLWI